MMAKIVAITGCPTGVAHTYMAAEALKKTAAVMGHEIRVETQGADGAKSPLSTAEIAAADVVIVASDIHVDMARFAGKPMTAVPVSDAIRKTRAVIETALAEIHQEETAAPGTGRSQSGGRRGEIPGRRHRLSHRHRAHLHGRRSAQEIRGGDGP